MFFIHGLGLFFLSANITITQSIKLELHFLIHSFNLRSTNLLVVKVIII